MIQCLAQQGWQCPICKRVLSPWTPECPCKGLPETYTLTTTSQPTKEEVTITCKS